MIDQEQQQQQKPNPTANDYLGAIYVVCDAYRCLVGPFLRYGQGAEAYSIKAFIVFVILLTFAAAERDPALWAFLALWIVALIFRRVQSVRLRKHGVIHSRYAGDPWLAFKVPFVKSDYTARGLIEPVICFLAGIAICPLSVNLGGLLMLGWPAMFIHAAIEKEIHRKRMERMADAQIDAQWYGDRFRRGE